MEKWRRETQGETLNHGAETISLLSNVHEMTAEARLSLVIDDGMRESETPVSLATRPSRS